MGLHEAQSDLQLDGPAGVRLADGVRSLLDVAAAASGAMMAPSGCITGYEGVAEKCGVVRGLLSVHAVACAVREFIGGLLYLVLASAPQLEDAHTWNARERLVEFLHQLCGGPVAAATPRTCKSSLECCPDCACRHIALQEALSLVRFFRERSGGFHAVSSCMEEGLGILLHCIDELVSALHAVCFAVAVGGPMSWAELRRDLAESWGSPIGWEPLATAALLAHLGAKVDSHAEQLARRAKQVAVHDKDVGTRARTGQAVATFRDFPSGMMQTF